MEDVYNRTTFERNGIQEVPEGYQETASNNLFKFLGSFWRNIHEGDALIRGVQNTRGLVLAQFYLDLLETLKLQDRKGLPVFHRELWKPLIIRKSKRNTAQENILKLGGEAVLGEQPSGSKYGEGTMLHIGRLANFDKYVAYPVEEEIESIVGGITNNIVNPTVSYKVSTEFPSSDIVYQNGTLIFPIDADPFGEKSEFDRYDIPEFYTVDKETGEQATDQETVLWASDALIDKNYLSEHMSYALGINCDSTFIAKAIINAGWDALNCGLTPELLRSLIAAMLNIPVIQNVSERITGIYTDEQSRKTVVTDSHRYTVSEKAVLRDAVKTGSVLHRGDFLDESVKIYPMLTDTSSDKLQGTTEYADIFKTDVPIISIPKELIRATTVNGLYVDWTPVDVIDTLEKDSNGHRKLYFDLGGAEEDVDAFWEDIWDYAERRNLDLERYIEDATDIASDSSDSDGTWRVIPAKFFLRYLIGANTLIVTFDRDQVDDASRLRDPMFFNMLNMVLPSGIRLFFIEHVTIDNDNDTYNIGDTGSSTAKTEETVDDYVYDDLEDDIDYSDLPGMRGKHIPTYEDHLEMKLIRNRKRHAE